MHRSLLLLVVPFVVSACSDAASTGAPIDTGSGTGGSSQPGTGGSVAAGSGGTMSSTGGTGGTSGNAGTGTATGGTGVMTGGSGGSAQAGSGATSTGGASGTGTATGGSSTAGTGTATGGASVGGMGIGGSATGGASMGGAAGTMAGAPGTGGASGSGGMGGSGGAAPSTGDSIAAPTGTDSAPGTLEEPTTLTSAITRITAGHTIFLRGGSYTSAAQITIADTNNGTSGSTKSITPYATEKPKLDFSSEPYGTSSNPRGLQINGDYWHVLGLEVLGAADNGIYVAGNNNVIESCVTHGNKDTGLQIGRASSDQTSSADWPSNNLILNCESYDNYDAPPGGGENADGFAAKLTSGTGNVFRGCISHNNIDDGWDLYTKSDTGPIGPVTIDQCVAYSNGTLTDGTSNDSGDRNGFKLGGEDIAVAHVVTRSVAFRNGKNGFTWNSNPGAIRLSNTLAFDNAEGNYKFGDNSTNTAAVFTNNVSFWTSTGSTQTDKYVGSDVANSNCWWDKSESQMSINGAGLIVTAADFAASLASATVTKNADGSPNFAPFALTNGSDLIDAGSVPAGTLPFTASSYYQGDPDLGAVEK